MRDILLIAQYDSKLLGHIDLTDGTYNAVEHTHSSCIEDLHTVGGDIYVEFDDYGARTAKYLGDGKFAPEIEDLGVAKFNAGAPRSEVYAAKRWPAGQDAFWHYC